MDDLLVGWHHQATDPVSSYDLMPLRHPGPEGKVTSRITYLLACARDGGPTSGPGRRRRATEAR
jgi:hypothetical protein